MIITIDGPAGSGKSTAARRLAAMLKIPYLDTGAMYRALTLKALETNTPLDDPVALEALALATTIELDCGPTSVRVIMDGRDVSEAIRSLRVSEHTNPVSAEPRVRAVLVEMQREIVRKLRSLVSEGRDQGSAVFPDADLKILLDASDVKRAERRCLEMKANGEEVDFDHILANVRSRDDNDRKQWAPLVASGTATYLDSTQMTIEQVVERLCQEVKRLRAKRSEAS